jgi:hypothetical protein
MVFMCMPSPVVRAWSRSLGGRAGCLSSALIWCHSGRQGRAMAIAGIIALSADRSGDPIQAALGLDAGALAKSRYIAKLRHGQAEAMETQDDGKR